VLPKYSHSGIAVAKKKGRKPFKATARLRKRVEELTFVGMSQDDIARAIGCSTPTLVKFFPEELATGAAKKNAEAWSLLWKNARSGNVSAQKKLVEEGRLAAAAAGAGNPKPVMPTGKVGKKQLEAAAAEGAGGEGTEWGNLLSPDARPN
jgi:hypothetical protein